MNQIYPEQAYLSKAQGCDVEVYKMTVGENIDRKIESHQKEIERLEASKKTLGPLLEMRIMDIQQAMNF